MIPIFFAVDTPDASEASDLLHKIGDLVDVKFGLEFFIANGMSACSRLRHAGAKNRQMFLDLKLHDIPNTVAGAVRSCLNAEPDFITVHASGGGAMMEAAMHAADEAKDFGVKRPRILAVTVLTSDDRKDSREAVEELATEAYASGMDGLVCSPHEAAHLRSMFKGGSDAI